MLIRYPEHTSIECGFGENIQILLRPEQISLDRLYTLPSGDGITYGQWIGHCMEFAEINSLYSWRREIEEAGQLYSSGNPWPLYSATLPSLIDLCGKPSREPSCIFILGPGSNIAELVVPAMLNPDASIYGIDSSPPRSYARILPRRIGNRKITFIRDDYATHNDVIMDTIRRSGDKITNPHLIARHPPVLTRPSDIGDTVLDGLAQWARYVADMGGSFALTTYTTQEVNMLIPRIASALPMEFADRLHVVERPRGTSPIIQRHGSDELRVDGWRLKYPDTMDTNQAGRVYP